MVALESPNAEDALYAARGEDVSLFSHRPRFTGDVLKQNGEVALVLQHPCAIRRGLQLVDRLLMASVVPEQGGIPRDWSKGSFKKFFLPRVFDGPDVYAADFTSPVIWTSTQVQEAERIAILSALGVNLLLQRWVHHNSRVVVSTSRFNDVISGPFEEADIVGEVCDDLVFGGGSLTRAEALIDDWLSDGHPAGSDRRSALSDPQHRASIRQQARVQTRIWVDDGSAAPAS